MEDNCYQITRWASTNPSILVEFSLPKFSEVCLESNCGITGMITSLAQPTIINQNSNIVEVIVSGVVVTVSVIVISSVILLIFIIVVNHRSKN